MNNSTYSDLLATVSPCMSVYNTEYILLDAETLSLPAASAAGWFECEASSSEQVVDICYIYTCNFLTVQKCQNYNYACVYPCICVLTLRQSARAYIHVQ